jgi:glycosyltransferase involved in cell wall biosynthesis
MKQPQTVHLSVLMMLKNEEKRLHVTLNSIEKFADSIVVFDTGSTDKTLAILKEFSERTNIPLRLKEGEFVDFSTSRNVSLEFADTFSEIDYLLLVDCNDELRGGDFLRKYAESMIDSPSTGFLICQEWLSSSLDKYYNLRFVKAHEGWRYFGVVHEWLKNTKAEEGKEPHVPRIDDSSVIYQDRTQDDDKSGKRFSRDKILLIQEYKSKPKDPRTLFYLAQTCSCLNDNEDSLFYYKLRIQVEGFQEEKFHAIYRSGELSEKLNLDWYESMSWYIKAYEHSSRAEPLIMIADHYHHMATMQKNLPPDNLEHHKQMQSWRLAFTFIDMACKLSYPDNAILFVNRRDYDYKRWHLLGIIAFYTGFYAEGKAGCERAIASGVNSEIDKSNLEFYIKREQEQTALHSQKDATNSKKEFVEYYTNQLKTDHPNLTVKQINSKVSKLWKNRKKT